MENEQTESRENIFTLFADAINDFTNHKLTKIDLYNRFVDCVEMSDEKERSERNNHIKKAENIKGTLVAAKDCPYSNWEQAKKLLS